MLSIYPIKSTPAVATQYYTGGDYYTKGADEPSAWTGKGADRLELNGTVNADNFKALLSGTLPEGHEAGWREADGEHHPGWDLTFSAPKGVSIMATIGGDTRLVDAHMEAVEEALEFAESYAHVRDRAEDGSYVRRPTGNIVAAQFTEFFSRALDAQLHTHAVIANMTYDEERGKWYSLDSGAFFAMKMAMGQVYRNSLALKTRTCGHELSRSLDTGLFDLRDIPKQLVKINSQRRTGIVAYADKHGWKSAAEYAVATLSTRPDKVKTCHSEVMRDLKERAGGYTKHLDVLRDKAQANERSIIIDINTVDEATKHALGHLSNREAVFEHGNVIREALKASVGETTRNDIEEALTRRDSAEDYQETKFQTGGRHIYHGRVIERSIAWESKLAEHILKHRHVVRPLASKETVRQHLDASRLTQEQKRAAAYILRTQDRVISVTGVAGSGKSHLVKAVVNATPSRTYLALAPTSTAAVDLGKSAGIKAQTLAGFLQTGGHRMDRNSVLFVDESSMTSTRQAIRLMQIAERQKNRIVFIGDDKQFDAIEQGKPLALMVEQGLRGPFIKHSFRQKNQEMQQLVNAARDGNTREVFSILGPRLNRIESKELAASVAEAWLEHPKRNSIQIAALDNASRIAINAGIRDGLQQEGKVGQIEHEFEILSSLALTPQQLRLADYYKKNQIVVFHTGQKALGIEKETLWKVIGTRNGHVLIKDKETSEKIAFDPKKIRRDGMNLYEVQERKLAVGDKIQWRKNLDGDRQVQNGHSGKIESIDGKRATIRFDHDIRRTLDLEKNPYWDLGYALTIFKQQGKTTPVNWVVANTRRAGELSLKTLYVSLTRAERSVKVFTDHIDRFKRAVQSNPGGKTSALEGKGIQFDLAEPIQIRTPPSIESIIDKLPDRLRTAGSNFLDLLDERERERQAAREDVRDPRIERGLAAHEAAKASRQHAEQTRDQARELARDGYEASR